VSGRTSRDQLWRYAGDALGALKNGATGSATGEVEETSFRFSELDLERETKNAKVNADARNL
jgi:hypothetical protein